MSEIISYELWPLTVAIGRDKNNRLREPRGFMGQIVFKIHHKKVRKIAEKTLSLARYLGIGRSRGIGLGEIDVIEHYRAEEEADHHLGGINDNW